MMTTGKTKLLAVICMLTLVLTGCSSEETSAKATAGEFTYKVMNQAVSTSVGTGENKLETDQQFLTVDLEITNDSEQDVRIDAYFFSLLNGEEEHFIADRATVYANMDQDGELTESFYLNTIPPGETKIGKIVFELPEDVAKQTDLKLVVKGAQTGSDLEQKEIKLDN